MLRDAPRLRWVAPQHEGMLLMTLRKIPHPEVPRKARPRRTHGIRPALRHFLGSLARLPISLAGIQAPVLLIHGRCDRMVAFEVSIAILNHIADWHLVLLKNRGHWPPFEKPAEWPARVPTFPAALLRGTASSGQNAVSPLVPTRGLDGKPSLPSAPPTTPSRRSPTLRTAQIKPPCLTMKAHSPFIYRRRTEPTLSVAGHYSGKMAERRTYVAPQSC